MSLTAKDTLVVGAIAPASNAEALAARPAAETLSAVEIRLDAFAEPPDFVALRGAFVGRRLIATLRSAAEGGRFGGTAEDRRGALSAALEAGFDLVDVEWSGGVNAGLSGLPPDRVILSVHDTEGIPADAPALVRRLSATPARLVKLVGTCHDSRDALRLLELQRDAPSGRLTVFGMGEAGIATRVLSPYLGAPLAYGALVPGRGTAPGQLSALDLVEIYGISSARRVSRVFALFGDRVSHSLSPAIHNAWLEAIDAKALYVPFALRSLGNELRPLSRGLEHLGLPLAGASVTIPFKEQAARLVGAAEPINTLIPEAGGGFVGFNTDRLAMEEVLPPSSGGRALVLGAGGAARTAVRVLAAKGYEVLVWNRTPERARELARGEGARALGTLTELEPLRALVNATPLGVRPEDPLPCPEALLSPGLVVLDAPYTPGGTALVRAAERAGARVIDGTTLLLLQASGQASLFTGRPVSAEDLLDRLPRRFRALFPRASREVPS